jgi:hypothetical protein
MDASRCFALNYHQAAPALLRWPGGWTPIALTIYRQKDGLDEEFLAGGQL